MYDGDIYCIVCTEWSDRSTLKNIDLLLGLYTIYRPHHIKGMMSQSYYNNYSNIYLYYIYIYIYIYIYSYIYIYIYNNYCNIYIYYNYIYIYN